MNYSYCLVKKKIINFSHIVCTHGNVMSHMLKHPSPNKRKIPSMPNVFFLCEVYTY